MWFSRYANEQTETDKQTYSSQYFAPSRRRNKNTTRDYFDATASNWNTSAHSHPPGEKLCIKTGSQIEGWVFSSLDHVIHAGQKCTISSSSGRGMFADYKSVFRLAISRIVLEKWAKKSENREIWANFDPPPPKKKIWGGSPHNFETSFGYFFSRTIDRKILDHAP